MLIQQLIRKQQLKLAVLTEQSQLQQQELLLRKQQLSQSLLAVLQDLGPWPEGVQVQLSVELRDMDRDTYSKEAVGS